MTPGCKSKLCRNIFIALAQVAAQRSSCDIFHEQKNGIDQD
jgi:hypothetical protein